MKGLWKALVKSKLERETDLRVLQSFSQISDSFESFLFFVFLFTNSSTTYIYPWPYWCFKSALGWTSMIKVFINIDWKLLLTLGKIWHFCHLRIKWPFPFSWQAPRSSTFTENPSNSDLNEVFREKKMKTAFGKLYLATRHFLRFRKHFKVRFCHQRWILQKKSLY